MATLFGSSFSQDVNLAQLGTANANRDGTGTVADVVTAGSRGSQVTSVDITATGTTTAGMVRFYVSDGTNTRLLDEVPVSAVTPSATVQAFRTTYLPSTPIMLPNGYKLRASTEKGETFNLVAKGVQY